MTAISHTRLRGAYLVCLYIGILLFVLGGVAMDLLEMGPLKPLLIVPGALTVLAGIVCAMVLLHACWSCVESHATRLPRPPRLIDPAAAVVLMVFPIVNVVGVFFALGLLPKALNQVAQSAGLKERTGPNGGYVVGFCMVCGLIPLLGLFFGLVAGLILLPITLWSCSRVAEAIERHSEMATAAGPPGAVPGPGPTP